jgi:hypothetical protein
VRRNGCRTFEALEVQQMATRVHNGNADSPMIVLGFGLSRSRNGLDIGEFEGQLSFHEGLPHQCMQIQTKASGIHQMRRQA